MAYAAGSGLWKGNLYPSISCLKSTERAVIGMGSMAILWRGLRGAPSVLGLSGAGLAIRVVAEVLGYKPTGDGRDRLIRLRKAQANRIVAFFGYVPVKH